MLRSSSIDHIPIITCMVHVINFGLSRKCSSSVCLLSVTGNWGSLGKPSHSRKCWPIGNLNTSFSSIFRLKSLGHSGCTENNNNKSILINLFHEKKIIEFKSYVSVKIPPDFIQNGVFGQRNAMRKKIVPTLWRSFNGIFLLVSKSCPEAIFPVSCKINLFLHFPSHTPQTVSETTRKVVILCNFF